MWGGFGVGMGGLNMGGYAARQFEEQYHCYSVSVADKSHLEVRTLYVSLLLHCHNDD